MQHEVLVGSEMRPNMTSTVEALLRPAIPLQRAASAGPRLQSQVAPVPSVLHHRPVATAARTVLKRCTFSIAGRQLPTASAASGSSEVRLIVPKW